MRDGQGNKRSGSLTSRQILFEIALILGLSGYVVYMILRLVELCRKV